MTDHDRLLPSLSMVPASFRSIDRTPNSVSSGRHYNIRQSGEFLSQSQVKNPRLQNFRTRYQNKGFSEKAINLLMATLNYNSSKTISSNLKIWISWCRLKSVDPVACDLSCICEFFANKMNEGKAFN